MKRKELYNLAKKIAKYEKIIQTSDDEKEIRQAQDEIMNMNLSGRIKNIEDMIQIDEMVQELLSSD